MKNQQAATTATAASKPLGMCEKLFNAFQPTIRPLRRLTFRQQEAAAAAPVEALRASPDKHSHTVPESKLPGPVAPPAKSKHSHKPKTQEKELPRPAPPKVDVMPLGTVPQLPPPPPPQAKAEKQKPKKGINERVDDYITRTKGKIRAGSGVGRAPSSK